MSSKNKNFHPDISSSMDGEKMQACIDVLSKQKPKISINTTFRNALRDKLLAGTQKKTVYSVFGKISFFSFFSIAGTVCASIVAVFGFWDIFSHLFSSLDSSPHTSPIVVEVSKSGSITPVDLAIFSGADTDDTRAKKTITEFKKEQHSINTEIEEIIQDINNIDGLDETPITPYSSPLRKEISKNTDAIIELPVQTSTLPEGSRNATAGAIAPMFRVIEPPIFSIPTYPKIMPIYQKQGSEFLAGEIRDKSGSGITLLTLETEPNQSILRNQIIRALDGKIPEGEATISYRSMGKKGEKKPMFYLVPNLRYTLEDGNFVFIPLIRGFE